MTTFKFFSPSNAFCLVWWVGFFVLFFENWKDLLTWLCFWFSVQFLNDILHCGQFILIHRTVTLMLVQFHVCTMPDFRTIIKMSVFYTVDMPVMFFQVHGCRSFLFPSVLEPCVKSSAGLGRFLGYCCSGLFSGISLTALSSAVLSKCPEEQWVLPHRLTDYGSEETSLVVWLNCGSHVESEVPLNIITKSLTVPQSGLLDVSNTQSLFGLSDKMILLCWLFAHSSNMFAMGVKFVPPIPVPVFSCLFHLEVLGSMLFAFQIGYLTHTVIIIYGAVVFCVLLDLKMPMYPSTLKLSNKIKCKLYESNIFFCNHSAALLYSYSYGK